MGALSLMSACGGDDDDNSGGGGSSGLTGADNGKVVAQKALPVCTSCHSKDYGGDGYYPNITNDMATGIGSWTDAEIKSAIREGKGKGGEVLCAEMPHYAASQISDSDLSDLVAFLRTQSVSRTISGECPED